MSRNAQSRFAMNPTNIDISRSTFDRSSSTKLSFNVGEIIPFYVDEVLPGDTFDLDTAKVVRLQSLITPVMDNIYLDTYYFFVPNRLVWAHWEEFCGENTESAWIPTTEYSIPQLLAPSGGWNIGTIADYMGIPTGVDNISVNALPFRAYAMIINEWFRDQNLSDPLIFPAGDTTVRGVNTGVFVTDVAKGGLPYIAAKYHDYFTSALPSPQKGPDVAIPGGTGANTPVVPLAETVPDMNFSAPMVLKTRSSEKYGYAQVLAESSGTSQIYSSSSNTTADSVFGITNASSPVNLWAIGDGSIVSATINQLRTAFAIQRMYEKDARGGTRYIEILKAHFGVTSPDARLQRPEYLGGNRVPISINQVVQTSSSVEGSPQGNTAAFSVTADNHSDFKHSFVEHGFLIGLCVARYDHTYQQGLERMWSRTGRFDYYWPVFANLGEQAILNKEIYAQGTDEDEEVFGYQEAWAEYRYKPSRVAGEMRSAAQTSLDVWHLADDYSALPALSPSWIMEDKANVDRVLAVSSSVSNQLFADIYVKSKVTRPMPMYSIPGLIDHH